MDAEDAIACGLPTKAPSRGDKPTKLTMTLSTAKDADNAKVAVMDQEPDKLPIDIISERVLKCAYAVHSALGPGLLESAYDACLRTELIQEGLQFQPQVRLPVCYRNVQIDAGYRIDFLIEDCLVVELKAVEKLLFLHKAQLLSYLKLSGRCLGLLINFNVPHLKEGIRRVVNGYPGK
jgi:GxxExxY protein